MLFIMLAATIASQVEAPSLVVSHKTQGFVGLYAPDGRLVASVPVGPHPHELLLTPDGKRVFVSDYGVMSSSDPGEGDKTISVIDLATPKRAVIDLGATRRPHGLAWAPRIEKLVVSTEAPNQILVIDPRSLRIERRFDTRGKQSHLVTVSHDGRTAYVSNSASGDVSIIDLASGATTLVATGARPVGSVLTRDDKRLFVANLASNTITVIDTEKRAVKATIQTGRGPARLELSADESELIYALLEGKQIGFADTRTLEQVGVLDLPGSPCALHLSSDARRAYAVVHELDSIYELEVGRRAVTSVIRVGKGSGPEQAVPLR